MIDIVYKLIERKITIGELYDRYYNNLSFYSNAGHEIIDIDNVSCLGGTTSNINTCKLEYLPIKRLIRHKVNKGKWRLVAEFYGDEFELITTEDHGLVKVIGCDIIRCCPKDISIGDIVIVNDDGEVAFANVTVIEQLEDFDDEYVYDIEMANDPHTYICNNILIHNSIYITLEKVFKHLNIKLQDSNGFITKEALAIIEELGGEKTPSNGIITKDLVDWGRNCLYSTDCRFEFKREKICNTAIFLNSKKQYILSVLDKEGVPYLNDAGYPQPKLSITGGELISSKHSKEIRNMIIDVVKILLKTKDQNLVVSEFSKVYDKYKTLDPKLLAIKKSVKTLKEYESYVNGLNFKSGVPQNSRAAFIYNELINKLKLNAKYQKIMNGDKINILYVAKNRFGVEYTGFLDKLPEEFGMEPNYKLLFDKNVGPIMERIFDSIGWQYNSPTKQYAVNLLDMI